MLDAVIAGGGPAGLNAALLLGRVRRKVLLADAGTPRNAPSPALHGFLSRDGEDPARLREIGRRELAGYPDVEVRDVAVASAAAVDGGFEVELADGDRVRCRRLMLATGMRDELPAVDGLAPLWGRGVYPCPYCHGWEVRDRPVAVLGGDDKAAHLALNLERLGCDVLLCPNGGESMGEPAARALKAKGVGSRPGRLASVSVPPGGGVRLVFDSGPAVERHALFVRPVLRQSDDLAARLGCATHPDGALVVNDLAQTSVPGVYAAGDLCRVGEQSPSGQISIAAGAGARCAMVIDQDLLIGDSYR